MESDGISELDRFERGEFDPKTFRHSEHVRIAHDMLRRERFVEALPRYARGIRKMAERAGRPEAYNETITTAFLALIAERMRNKSVTDFATFSAVNANLFDKRALDRHYTRERLQSPDARSTFLLPDRA